MYVFLDIFFIIFHSSLIVFNLVGWIWKRARKAHLLVLSLTMCSWFGLGNWYGFGYCPVTDWHWQVKRKLGESELPTSYVKYCMDKLTGLDWNPAVLDSLIPALMLAAFGVSLCLNWRNYFAHVLMKGPQ